ncbi:MAG: NAD-dependent epimerase/dehydratase family protein [Candidatus Obscuribacterales bacterium]|nr:NAD-dependent epimerase/dehydratase family protein [Candidatus Obscuribacterales bacterium]
MNLLITGSEGSLAQMVIPEFQKLGYSIIGVDNFARYGSIDRNRNYQFLQMDLTDSSAVQEVFSKHNIDVVFHAAALVYGVVGFHEKPADIIVDNNLMTMNLLKHGADKIRHFVYLSSSMVYERSKTVPHKEEDADLSPVMSTSYGLSKYIGERVVRSFHEQFGTKYTIWRPFNIITPYESPEDQGVSHVFADMIRKIIVEKQKPLKVLGDGQQVRCFTNIFDVAEAIAAFSMDPKAENEIFNIGNPEPVTILQLTEIIVDIAKSRRLLPASYSLTYEHLPVYADDVRLRIPDVSKIERVFSWKAKTSLRQSLEQCIEHQIATKVLSACE